MQQKKLFISVVQSHSNAIFSSLPLTMQTLLQHCSGLLGSHSAPGIRQSFKTRCNIDDGSGWPSEVRVWKMTLDGIGVKNNPEGWSDPAHVELTLTPMVNNAMASARAFATAL
jgi:hypothetical protein